MSVSLFPKKITTKTMGLSVSQLEGIAEANQPSPVPVLRVWGIINEIKSGVSTYGPYTEFYGEIAALNYITNEEARSMKLLLPGVADAMLKSLFNQAASAGGSAQFAIDVTVQYNKPRNENSNFTKFTYGIKPLIDFKGEDALTTMAKALPAPKSPEGDDKPKHKKSQG